MVAGFDMASIVFYTLGGLMTLSALCVVLMKNPIYSALALAVTMTSAAALFFSLDAYFVAGVQLIVYAGAVVVMFVMVVMLIDLKHEGPAFSRGAISTFLKFFGTAIVGGVLVLISSFAFVGSKNILLPMQAGLGSTKALAIDLFTKYLFGFEVVGVLLLAVLIGAIAISRARGGTHHA